MKRATKLVLAITSAALLTGMSELQYTQYAPKDTGFPVAFEYPKGWPLDIEQGKIDPYQQIRIMGPQNSEDSYHSYLVVLRAPLQAEGKYSGTDAFLQNYKDHQLRRSEVLWERKATLGGLEAKDLLVQYTMPAWRHKDLHAPEVPVKTRIIVTSDRNYLYQLMYSADAREFDTHAKTFEHLIETFRLAAQ